MDVSGMPRRETPERDDGDDAPVGGAAPLAPGQRWSVADGCAAHEIAVIVRSDTERRRARNTVKAAAARAVELSDKMEVETSAVAISAMHRAKGLEIRAVTVMAGDDEITPLQSRIEAVGDDADLQEVHDTERDLLYVARTRAGDYLLASGARPLSEFIADLAKPPR